MKVFSSLGFVGFFILCICEIVSSSETASYEKKLEDFGTKLQVIKDEILDVTKTLSSDFKTLSNRVDLVQLDMAKTSKEACTSNQLQLNETDEIKTEIKRLSSKVSEINVRIRDAHIGIPVNVFKSTKQGLNASFDQVKEYLEFSWSLLFGQAGWTPPVNRMIGKSCKELKTKYSLKETGEYLIQPDVNDKSDRKTKIYCDMAGGGWSVIQRRGVRDIPKAQRESFYRNWTEYEEGFGSVRDDHWIGLRNIHHLTNQDSCGTELMVTLTKWDGTEKYAKHTTFSVSGSEDGYRLSIEGYEGNATDHDSKTAFTMLYNNNERFATFDRDNENDCVADRSGAWWHSYCTNVNLNGDYSEDGKMGKRNDKKGIYWFSSDIRRSYSFKKTEMKIKSKC